MNLLTYVSLFALVLLAPLPFGSVQPWALGALEIVIFLMGIFWCIRLFISKNFKIQVTPLGWALIAFVGLALLQTLSLPILFLKVISPETFNLYQDVGVDFSKTHSISIYPYATKLELYKIAAFALFYLLIVNQKNKKLFHGVLYTVIAIGVFEAIYGLYELWSGRHQIFGYRNMFNLDSASGTFINRNHYAAFLEMCIPIALGFFLSGMYKIARRHLTFKEYVLDLFSEKTLPYFLCLFAAMMMMIALIFSGSRGGIISIVISLTFFLGFALFLFRGLFRKFHALIFLIILVFGFFWISKGDLGLVSKRFGTIRDHLQARQNIWLDSLAMASDFSILGSGLGTYEYLLPRYQNLFIPPVYISLIAYVDHAHNEYIELVCETGLIGFFILIAGGILTLWRVRRRMDLLRLGILTGLISISIHNFIEFNLRIPANALFYLLLFGLLNFSEDEKEVLKRSSRI